MKFYIADAFTDEIFGGNPAGVVILDEACDYPDAETISKGEWQNDVGDASRLYEEYYQKLKAGR